MFKVQARPAFKLNYFPCRKGALHDGQALNYVCIQKDCKQNGLICSVCKSDHEGHKVVPLKYLLNTLKNHNEKPMMSQNFQNQLEQLEKLKNSFLYELKTIVQRLSQKIQKIQEQIIEIFKAKKVQLLNQIEINMKFNEIIQQTLSNNNKDQQSFEKDFKTIASLVENRKGGENDLKSESFEFSVNLNKIIKQYQSSYVSFSQKINKFCVEAQSSLNTILNNSSSPVEPEVKPIIPLKNLFNSSNTLEYKFSSVQKGTNIKISPDLKTAECTAAGSQRFALIDGIVNKKGSSIRFKIQKLKNWVGIGLAIRNNIVSKNYQFLYNNLGHGSFLLSNNSYMWSHAFAANNIQNSGFAFVEGNIIKIEVNDNQLIYTNESQNNKSFKLPISLNETEWKEACFCANLCSIGDAATIL